MTPQEFIDVKALMGDSSDNIPGVPSIGEKTATSLIATFHSIENAYAHLPEVKPPRAQKALGEHYDMAQMSKELGHHLRHRAGWSFPGRRPGWGTCTPGRLMS